MQFLCQCAGTLRHKQAPLQRAYFALSCGPIWRGCFLVPLKIASPQRTLLVQYLDYAPKQDNFKDAPIRGLTGHQTL
jgi:hypothetical protein